MQLEGTVQNGVVILDQKDMISDGTRVEITPIGENGKAKATLGQRLMWLAGSIDDMPADFAEEHNHYIHGTPRRKPKGGE